MKIVVGLGNPDKKYEGTRHNVGFIVVDEIFNYYNFPAYKDKFSGQVSKGKINGEDVIILKPMTYMNLSGQSVGACAKFYKVKPEDIIVLHDDLDLPFAKIKVKVGGGHGGHNGLKSIDAHVGNKFKRVKIGIHRPEDKQNVANYVLKDFSKDEKIALNNKLAPNLAQYMELLLDGDDSEFMNKLHLF